MQIKEPLSSLVSQEGRFYLFLSLRSFIKISICLKNKFLEILCLNLLLELSLG